MYNNIKFQYIGPNFVGEKIAILNSHQSKYPVGNDKWIIKINEIVKESIENNNIILSSLELNTYEILIYLTKIYNGTQIIIIPYFKNQDTQKIIDYLVSQFLININKTGFLFFSINIDKKFHKIAWKIRDEIIIKEADIIYPISIRENGFLDTLLKNNYNKIIDNKYRINFTKPIYELEKPPKIEEIKEFNNWNYLTHWTSSLFAPYPNETLFDFYQSILNSKNIYSHNAFNTLINILKTKIIIANNKIIKGKYNVISFTENNPKETIKFMLWRNNRFRYNYEPYGIAINKDYLIKIGAKKVIYENNTNFNQLNEEEKPFFQYYGKDKRWQFENEWRYLGNLNIENIPKQNILILVKTEKEKKYIKENFNEYNVECLLK